MGKQTFGANAQGHWLPGTIAAKGKGPALGRAFVEMLQV
jgi:hypothetical protein